MDLLSQIKNEGEKIVEEEKKKQEERLKKITEIIDFLKKGTEEIKIKGFTKIIIKGENGFPEIYIKTPGKCYIILNNEDGSQKPYPKDIGSEMVSELKKKSDDFLNKTLEFIKKGGEKNNKIIFEK